MLNSTLPCGHAARPDGDRYLTPRWAVQWFSQYWTPNPGTLIYDPSAGGYDGFTIGGYLAELHNREYYLADINPLADNIIARDYLTARSTTGTTPVSIITNPPYGILLESFLRKSLHECGGDGEVIPYLWLMDTDRTEFPEPTTIWQAQKRYEFELTEEDYLRRIENGGSGRASRQSSTGFSAGSPGGAHVWVRWVPNYTGDTTWTRRSVTPNDQNAMIIKPDIQISLFQNRS